MRGMIRTIKGDILPSEMGITYSHEHILWSPPEPFAHEDPDLVMMDYNAAISELRAFATSGGKTIVEMTTMELNRDPIKMLEIANATTVNIIAATGFNKAKYSKGIISSLSINQIADLMTKDLLEGMDNTAIRAGVIKASSSLNIITEEEKKVFIAAAISHKRTGAPISTHTEAGTMAIEQITLLIENSVNPSRILIGHLDRNMDLRYIESVAKFGVMLGLDQIGKEKYASDMQRITLIKHLIERGYKDQILISGDMARRSSWKSYGCPRALGLTYILDSFIPLMRESSLGEELIQTIFIQNPARFFAWNL
jgi:predicted metal-dependent phosphotriesterase family hydrolase